MRRSLSFRLAIAAMLAQSFAAPARADPPKVKVMQPPGFDLETLKAVLTDPKPSVGGAVMTVASLAMWSVIGNFMAHTKMCQEANSALRTPHHQFTVKVTVLSSGGDPAFTYDQSYLAVASAGGVAYAPIRVLPDGTVITAQIKYCLGAKAWGLPPTALLPPTAGPAHWRAGVRHISHETRQGRVIIRLPEDVRAGDTISGTVLVEPQGTNDAERQANAAQLSGYVIEAEGRRNPVSDGKVLLTVAQAGGMVPLLLRDPAGNQVSLMGVAAPAADAPVEFRPPPQPQGLPLASQAGQPLTINGFFDGNAANTTVSINNVPAEIIAESPRMTIIDCPPGVTGPVAVTTADPMGTATAKTNLVGILLSTPRTTLMRGEKTIVTLQVSGLEGLQQRLSVAVQASPSVRLQGGNMQTVAIDPARAAGGVAQRQFNLTMKAPGPFDVSAQLLQPSEAAPAPATQPRPAQPPRRRMGM